MPLNRTPLTRAFWRHLALLPSRTRLNLTVIQIRQLKRSYSRRLKFDLAFYVCHGRYTTCLPFNESRCQNQSTPLLVILILALPSFTNASEGQALGSHFLFGFIKTWEKSSNSSCTERSRSASILNAFHWLQAFVLRSFSAYKAISAKEASEGVQSYQKVCITLLFLVFSCKFYTKCETWQTCQSPATY